MVIIMNTIKITFLSIICFLASYSCTSDPATSQASKTDITEKEYTKTISPADFLAAYRATPGAVMIDVRTNKEYYGGRMVPEAINVDYHGENFLTEIVTQDRDQPIFVYCYSGGRSSKAAYKMRQLGFDRIYECAGGYQQWEKENIK